jgi:hypothetical protein
MEFNGVEGIFKALGAAAQKAQPSGGIIDVSALSSSLLSNSLPKAN